MCEDSQIPFIKSSPSQNKTLKGVINNAFLLHHKATYIYYGVQIKFVKVLLMVNVKFVNNTLTFTLFYLLIIICKFAVPNTKSGYLMNKRKILPNEVGRLHNFPSIAKDYSEKHITQFIGAAKYIIESKHYIYLVNFQTFYKL